MGSGSIMFTCGGINCQGKLRFTPQPDFIACGGSDSGGGKWLVKDHQI